MTSSGNAFFRGLRIRLALARFVVAQAVRQRYIHGLLLAGMAGMGISLALSRSAVGGSVEVLSYLSLSLTELFGLAVVLTLPATLIRAAVEDRSILIFLSRNVSRQAVTTGILLGVCGLIAICVVSLFGLATLFRSGAGGAFSPAWFTALPGQLLGLFALAAVATALSTFSTPFLTGFVCLGLYIAGNGVSLILRYGALRGGVLENVLQVAARCVPDLEGLNVKSEAVYNAPLPWEDLLLAALNVLAWLIAAWALACLVMARRTLK